MSPDYMEQSTIKTLAATSPQKFSFKSFREAQAEINRLRTELAAKNAAPAAAAEPDQELVGEILAGAVAEVRAERAALTGRDKFIASVVREVGAKPATHPELRGRQRFLASLPGTTPSAAPASGLKGRERFAAGIKKDFSPK
jgi:hypothetical protein